MANVVRKKQDDNLKQLRELVTTGAGNRQCFDCGQKGPTYVDMTIGSFVCTRCSGVLRGLTPPHRVKSISMATFTPEELEFLKTHGNDLCAKTWLGLWDPKRAVHQDHREMMVDKYEHKRYYLEPASPLKSLTTAPSNTQNQTLSNGYTNTNSSNNSQRHNSGSEHSFQLTPPSQRTTANGLHKGSSSAISRPQSSSSQQQQQQDAFGLNVSLGSSGASTGALSDSSSCASNGFGAEADFIADFGSANIFNATNSTSPAAVSSSASSVASTNGYAKIQPIRLAHNQQKQQQQQNGGHKVAITNGTSSLSNGNSNGENFADFDHAPIFTPIGLTPNGVSKHATSANAYNNNNLKTPAEDRYAALKDLDEQLRESKAAAAAVVTVNSGETYALNNNNNNHNGISLNGNGVNPFKSQQIPQQQQQINPFQAQQQQQQLQQQQLQQTPNLYGHVTVMTANGNGYAPAAAQQQMGYFNYSNGFAAAGNNGMFPPTMMSATPAASTGPNGCGFGFGAMQQQIAASGGMTMGGAVFNNPFAATGVNTNNPFL